MVAGIVSAGIGALGNILGGLGSNALSSYQAQQLAEYQAKLNYKYAKKSAVNMPTYNRQGIEKAGYNPMLALGSIGASNSNWTSAQGLTTPDFSDVGSNAVSNALSVQQQRNQNDLATAQINNTNADTQLKQQQTLTETFEQAQKQVHADLERIDSELKRKDLSYYDRKYLLWEKHMNTEIERMNVQNRADIMQAQSSQIQANASIKNAVSNAQDVSNRYDLGKNQVTETRSGSFFGIGGSWTSSGYKKDGLHR